MAEFNLEKRQKWLNLPWKNGKFHVTLHKNKFSHAVISLFISIFRQFLQHAENSHPADWRTPDRENLFHTPEILIWRRL